MSEISEVQLDQLEDYGKIAHRHGWVSPQPHGCVAKCGGPALCKSCMQELGGIAAAEIRRLRAENAELRADLAKIKRKIAEAEEAEEAIRLAATMGVFD